MSKYEETEDLNGSNILHSITKINKRVKNFSELCKLIKNCSTGFKSGFRFDKLYQIVVTKSSFSVACKPAKFIYGCSDLRTN